MIEAVEISQSELVDLDQPTAAQLAELFRAMSDPSRLRILAVLLGGELHVGAIAGKVEMSESSVSHHLRGLRQMRLVRAHKQGREVYYQLDDEHVLALFTLGLEHVRHG